MSLGDMEITKHSVHTLVFRSIKRTHDMFLADHAVPLPLDEKSTKLKMACKRKDEYKFIQGPKTDHPGQDSSIGIYATPNHLKGNQLLAITGSHAYPYAAGVKLSSDTATHSQPSAESANVLSRTVMIAENQNEKLPMAHGMPGLQNASSQNKKDAKALVLTGESKVPFSQGIVARKAPTMPKPSWHPPWKLMRVISGHTGWVRCIAVEPANKWFCTGSSDRTIKIWDLASGKLKLSLTGHISTVRGLAVSNRHPYLFSAGEDKQVKCWDLEYNKVIRHYHGHLSAVYCMALHPTIDVLATGGRDSTVRIWDMRTKASIHALSGHSNTIADIQAQSAEPQIISGSHDSTIRYWDLAAGKTRVTLTNHKKSIRGMALHPSQYTMASASADNIKQWKFPDGDFIQNLSGHNAILNCLALNQDNVLVSGGDNGSMYFWDWKTGHNFQRIQAAVQPGSLDSEAGIFSMTYDMSGCRLLTTEADKTIKMYKEDDTATEESHPINWKPDIIKRKRF